MIFLLIALVIAIAAVLAISDYVDDSVISDYVDDLAISDYVDD